MPFGNVHVGVQGIQVGEVEEFDVVRHRCADIQVALKDDSLERRADQGAGKVQIRQGGRVDRLLEFPAPGLEILITHHTLGMQLAAPFGFPLAGIPDHAGAVGGDLLFVVLEVDQYLPGLHLIPLLDEEFPDHTPGARLDHRPLIGPEGGAGRVKRGERFPPHRGGVDGDGVPGLLSRQLLGRFGAVGGGRLVFSAGSASDRNHGEDQDQGAGEEIPEGKIEQVFNQAPFSRFRMVS